jgi:hypothetical protein
MATLAESDVFPIYLYFSLGSPLSHIFIIISQLLFQAGLNYLGPDQLPSFTKRSKVATCQNRRFSKVFRSNGFNILAGGD